MSPFFRTMRATGNKPTVADHKFGLGVRDDVDVFPTPGGEVRPGEGGMSVVEKVSDILQFLLPRGVLGGTGPKDVRIWQIPGESLNVEPLRTRPEGRPGHHLVEPVRPMQRSTYVAAIAATRDGWQEFSPS